MSFSICVLFLYTHECVCVCALLLLPSYIFYVNLIRSLFFFFASAKAFYKNKIKKIPHWTKRLNEEIWKKFCSKKKKNSINFTCSIVKLTANGSYISWSNIFLRKKANPFISWNSYDFQMKKKLLLPTISLEMMFL